MFNDLNSSNNQNRQAVDDIFAETDKTQESVAAPAAAPKLGGGGEIDTQRIGLTGTEELSESAPEKKGKDKLFKIIIILIVVAVLGLAGYLVYAKFFNAPVETEPAATATTTKKSGTSQTTTPASGTQSGSFVETAGSTVTPVTPGTEEATPLIPGVNAPATTTTGTVAATSTQAAMIDSDDDGLTDTEEKTAGTNINIIDTDNDGLSDYEEVKIYKTNPLSADTDGDSYLDGAEVKSGYNPNGAGKLSDATPKTSSVIK